MTYEDERRMTERAQRRHESRSAVRNGGSFHEGACLKCGAQDKHEVLRYRPTTQYGSRFLETVCFCVHCDRIFEVMA